MQLTAPESRAPPLPSTYGLTSGSFIVHAAAGDDCVARPTLFTYAEADAHLFLAQFQDLVASPLRMVKSYVLDQDKKGAGRVAHLSVTPPPNHCARPGAQLKTRCAISLRVAMLTESFEMKGTMLHLKYGHTHLPYLVWIVASSFLPWRCVMLGGSS